ncbi:MAG: MFS transporter [Deltaproteobacteria bacterium]|nr:MFS transporter [Deltaproteobacteria bacterium]
MNYLLLFLFWSLWYFNYSSRIILSPLLPLIEDTLSINHAMAGSLYLPFHFGSTISVVSGGFLSLRLGYKKLIFFSFILLAIILMLLSFVRDYPFFMVMSFFLGLGSGLYIPCATPLLTLIFSREHWGKAISFHEAAAGCALMSIPFFTAVALNYISWYSIFRVLGILNLALVFVLMLFIPDPRPSGGQDSHLSSMFRRKDFWILILVFITVGIASMGIYNIMPLFLVKEKGMSIGSANTLFGISRIGGFLAMILTGIILDRFNLKKIFFFITLITGIFTTAMALPIGYNTLFLMLVLQATFSVVFFPVGVVVISRITTQKERGIITGILFSVAGVIGPGLSPIILGAIADVWSFTSGIFVVGIITTISGFFINRLNHISE